MAENKEVTEPNLEFTQEEILASIGVEGEIAFEGDAEITAQAALNEIAGVDVFEMEPGADFVVSEGERAENEESPGWDDPELLAQIAAIPDRMAFKIGEVAELVGVKTYVLRYWESEFEELRPKKSSHNQRMYTRNDVKTILMIKKLLYKDRFSIEGARKALRKLKTEVKKEEVKLDLVERYDKAIRRMNELVEDIQSLRSLMS